MSRYTAIVVLLMLSFSCLASETVETAPPERPDPTIRVATYNVLNLFDHVDDPAIIGDIDDLPMATTDGRCRSLAEVIRRVDADVLALQEVESEAALLWFRDTYLDGMGYDHVVSLDVGYARGVENAVLSRLPLMNAEAKPNIPLQDVVRHGGGWAEPGDGDEAATYQRTPLRVDVAGPDGYLITMFVVHHKSGRHKYRRESEALKLVELIGAVEQEDPARNIIVLGDFNAAPWDRSMDVYGEAGFIDIGADPRSERPKTHESDRILDFVLLNSAAHREYVGGSVTVHESQAPPKDYDWRKDPRPDACPSDHRAVSIDLRPADRK
jgi:endonuclease/exonuclease/phosphatase family metal-dependent hydrolase